MSVNHTFVTLPHTIHIAVDFLARLLGEQCTVVIDDDYFNTLPATFYAHCLQRENNYLHL